MVLDHSCVFTFEFEDAYTSMLRIILFGILGVLAGMRTTLACFAGMRKMRCISRLLLLERLENDPDLLRFYQGEAGIASVATYASLW